MLIGTMSVLGVVQSESWRKCVALTKISQLQIGRSWSRRREWTSLISPCWQVWCIGSYCPTSHSLLELSERKILCPWRLHSFPPRAQPQCLILHPSCLRMTGALLWKSSQQVHVLQQHLTFTQLQTLMQVSCPVQVQSSAALRVKCLAQEMSEAVIHFPVPLKSTYTIIHLKCLKGPAVLSDL